MQLKPLLVREKTLVIAERRNIATPRYPNYHVGYLYPPDVAPTPFFALSDGSCRRDSELEPGFPILGGVNFNLEVDHFFGRNPSPSSRVPVSNPNPGRRYLVHMGSTGESVWAVVSRASEPRQRDTTSDLYRLSGKRWTRLAGAGPRGVDWPYVASWGTRVLVAERDQRKALTEKGDAVEWRLRVIGSSDKAPSIKPHDDGNSCSGTQITGLYAFDSGEVLTTGATCERALLVERWADANAAPVGKAIPGVMTDELGLGYEIDVQGPSLVRARSAHGVALELTFDREWRVGPATAPLRQDVMLTRLDGVKSLFNAVQTFILSGRVFVFGVAKQGMESSSVLLSDSPVTSPCVADDPMIPVLAR